jgi:DNA-directed RNA polymerase subunit K/omega
MVNAESERSDDAAARLARTGPLESRFLFVDVSAQRAKQLRRGALPRLPGLPSAPPGAPKPDYGRKLERLAMDEVRSGYIDYTLPSPPGHRGTSS